MQICTVVTSTVNVSSCAKQWSSSSIEHALVTFVVPSIGRSSLRETLFSILNQTDSRFLALVILDGLSSTSLYFNTSLKSPLPTYYHDLDEAILQDDRICFVHTTSDRRANCGAAKRNLAVPLVPTPWIGFVDDDDILDKYYVHHLVQSADAYPTASCVLFRMCVLFRTQAQVFPRHDSDTFYRQEVGISFAVRTDVFTSLGYAFHASNWEDFLFLDTLRRDHIPILLSAHMTYFVRGFNSSLCHQYAQFAPNILITNSSSYPYLRTSGALSAQEKQKELQSARLWECTQRGNGQRVPHFVFTETSSPFFGSNIRGLQESLQNALQRGCHGHWLNMPHLPIHIVFDARTQPISPFYIQVQLEQLGTQHFSLPYQSKLQSALQIWEFQNDQDRLLQRLSENSLQTPTYFVPTMLMLDRNDPEYRCSKQTYETSLFAEEIGAYDPMEDEEEEEEDLVLLNGNSSRSTQASPTPTLSILRQATQYSSSHRSMHSVREETIINLYHGGFYHTCRVMTDVTVPSTSFYSTYLRSEPSDCRMRHRAGPTSEYCYWWNSDGTHANRHSIRNAGAVRLQGQQLCKLVTEAADFDILVFGKLHHSDGNQREQLCDTLTASPSDSDITRQVLCAEGVFGALRRHLVCRARLVLVSHYYHNTNPAENASALNATRMSSALETHRLDPLLQGQRLVLFQHSPVSSSPIEQLYVQHLSSLPDVNISRIASVVGLAQEAILLLDRLTATTTESQQPYALEDAFRWKTQLYEYQRRSKLFVKRMTSTLDPLCFALSQLQPRVLARYAEYQTWQQQRQPLGRKDIVNNGNYTKNATEMMWTLFADFHSKQASRGGISFPVFSQHHGLGRQFAMDWRGHTVTLFAVGSAVYAAWLAWQLFCYLHRIHGLHRIFPECVPSPKRKQMSVVLLAKKVNIPAQRSH